MMSYIEKMNIELGDRVLVASSISKIRKIFITKGERFDVDIFIEKLQQKIGEEGTLVFPTYNWDFCKGEIFNYKETKSKTGILTQKALERSDFIRTKYPIYSMTVWGKDSKRLFELENISSFGNDSPFAFFYENNYKMVTINVDFSNSFTFIHYVEEEYGVPFRFLKKFTGGYIDNDGKYSKRTYSMYVRYLNCDVEHSLDEFEKIAEDKKIVETREFFGIKIKNFYLKKIKKLIAEDILENKCRKISQFNLEKIKITQLKEKLFPICRSITGNGLRESLNIIGKEVPLNILEIPTGTKAFDWEVPREWNIKDAYVKGKDGNRIIEFNKSNLHVLGYSAPIKEKLSKEELLEHIYTLPDLPNAIPYLTS